MQKYKLVYETKDETTEILLLGKEDQYESSIEISFIDSFTTTFVNEQECINYLHEQNIISSTEGRLLIKRPNGYVSVTSVLYNDLEFRQVSKQVNNNLKQMKRMTPLKETYEFKSVQNKIINFFYQDEEAMASFENTFFSSKSFVQNLAGYISYKNHSANYEPSEIAQRESFKNGAKSILKNYEILRNVYVWIYQHKKAASRVYSRWENPFAAYEKKKDELEERKKNL